MKKFNLSSFLNSKLPGGFSTAVEFLGARSRYTRQINDTLAGMEKESVLRKIREEHYDSVSLFSFSLEENILFFSSQQHEICQANKVEVVYIEKVPEENNPVLQLEGQVHFRLLSVEPQDAKEDIVMDVPICCDVSPHFDDGHECCHSATGNFTFTTISTYYVIKEIILFFLELRKEAELVC